MGCVDLDSHFNEATEDKDIALSLKNMNVNLKGKEILKDFSLDIVYGEKLGLVGKSGGGKSVFLKSILGLIPVSSGKLSIDKYDIKKNKKILFSNVGFGSQSPMMYEDLSLRRNLLYFGSLFSIKKSKLKKRIEELSNFFGLNSFLDYSIKHLSGGMQKRATIMISLINDPVILLLDEPTANLDPLSRSKVWEYINSLNVQGKTILVTTHLIDELEKNCDRIAVLKDKKISFIGKPKNYLKFYEKENLEEVLREIFQGET